MLITMAWAVMRRDARATQRLHRVQLERIALNRRMLEAELQVMEAQIEPGPFILGERMSLLDLYVTVVRNPDDPQALGSVVTIENAQ